ncbi:Uncharacterised protein [Candidatus Burarchaeum australiense]|nr:Uncharacterised protein [Candidatus Burarchaeum australiense]
MHEGGEKGGKIGEGGEFKLELDRKTEGSGISSFSGPRTRQYLEQHPTLNERLAAYVRKNSLAKSGQLKDPNAMLELEKHCLEKLRDGTAGYFVYSALNYITLLSGGDEICHNGLEKAGKTLASEYSGIIGVCLEDLEETVTAPIASHLSVYGLYEFFEKFRVAGEVCEVMCARELDAGKLRPIRMAALLMKPPAYPKHTVPIDLAKKYHSARESSPNKNCIYACMDSEALESHMAFQGPCC